MNKTFLVLAILFVLLIPLIFLIFGNENLIEEKPITEKAIECNSCEDCTAKASVPNSIITLTQDLSSNKTCILINADNVTFDCKNHKLTGLEMHDACEYENGILADTGTAEYINDVTIKNCKIEKYCFGIRFEYSKNSQALNNNIFGSYYIGIIAAKAGENISIINNKIFDSLHGGILIQERYIKNLIDGNEISSIYSPGMDLASYNGNDIITNNYIHDVSSYGINTKGKNTLISNNIISNATLKSSYYADSYAAISLYYAENNIIEKNTLKNNNVGIRFAEFSNNNTERNNIFENNIQNIQFFPDYSSNSSQ